jgi:hypothetical protein
MLRLLLILEIHSEALSGMYDIYITKAAET